MRAVDNSPWSLLFESVRYLEEKNTSTKKTLWPKNSEQKIVLRVLTKNQWSQKFKKLNKGVYGYWNFFLKHISQNTLGQGEFLQDIT